MKIVTVIPLGKGIFKANLTYFTSKDIKNGEVVSISLRNKKILGIVVSSSPASLLKSGLKSMPFSLKKITETKKISIFKKEFIDSAILLDSYFVSQKNSALSVLIPSLFKDKYDRLEKTYEENNENKNTNNSIPKGIKTEKLLLQASFEDRISFYKTLIRGSFANKKSVFMVLPTEYDIDKFYQSLSKGIEKFIFPIYGNLKSQKIIEIYEEIMKSEHGVLILGTAQFLSIPRNDIGTVIVEHESSNAYKSIQRPHFDMRTFAEIYASKMNAKFILGDTLLRLETIERKNTDNLGEIYPMSFRTNFEKIKISVINPSKDRDDATKENTEQKTKKFRIFDDKVLEEIAESIKNKKNVFIFSLRKGLATHTLCRDCGEILNCDKCMAPVVLYLSKDEKKRMFVCNKCNTEKDPETKCSYCGGWNLIPLGIGTDTIYEEAKKLFSSENDLLGGLKAKIFKLDKESATTGNAAKKIIKEFEKTGGGILVGTEMSFFYMKDKVDLSVMASFDSLWSIPNYKMGEKVAHLLISTLEKTDRKIIIQTKNEKDLAISALKAENLLPFVREELNDRKELGYPPFKRLIKITSIGNKENSLTIKKYLENALLKYNPDIFSGFVSKNKDKYITNAIIKIDPKKWSLPELSSGSSLEKELENILTSLPPSCEITIDPEDLL